MTNFEYIDTKNLVSIYYFMTLDCLDLECLLHIGKMLKNHDY